MTTQRLLAFTGFLGGIAWILIGLFPPDWGPPGTRAYEGYQLWNRLWAPALLLMALGYAGLFRALQPVLTRWARAGLAVTLSGFGLMMLGNFAEFWIFTTESYAGVGRNVSWMTFLLGTLIMLIGSTLAGLALLRSNIIPKWLATLLALMLPLTIGIGAVNLSWLHWPTGLPIILIGVWRLLSTSLIRSEAV